MVAETDRGYTRRGVKHAALLSRDEGRNSYTKGASERIVFAKAGRQPVKARLSCVSIREVVAEKTNLLITPRGRVRGSVWRCSLKGLKEIFCLGNRQRAQWRRTSASFLPGRACAASPAELQLQPGANKNGRPAASGAGWAVASGSAKPQSNPCPPTDRRRR
jgi:hypothetical protein